METFKVGDVVTVPDAIDKYGVIGRVTTPLSKGVVGIKCADDGPTLYCRPEELRLVRR